MDEENVVYKITPKGFVLAKMLKLGLKEKDAEDFWYQLEAFCYKDIQKSNPEADYAGLIFDGEGGTVLGFCSGPEEN
jgi:hypothetical protein